MMDWMIKCLKDWRVWVLAVLAVVCAAVSLTIGKVAGFFIAGVVAITAAVGVLVQWVLRRFRSRSALEMARGMLSIPSPPVSEAHASVQDLSRGFRQALDKLGNAPDLGPDYLYRVPWYLIAGEPASGKTTTIRYSNLELIGDKQQGVGGTLNCDWWFTNHGIILDTAGRYVYAEEGAPDRKEWESFLGLLRRYRPRQPLNGVIVVIPVVRTKGSVDLPLLLPPAEAERDPELADRATRDAEKLYEKISQLPLKLGVRFPIYILVTKCDKIPGFQEFFTQALMEYQTQLLGWSNPDVEASYTTGMVDKAFEGLDRNLERARLEVLAREMPLSSPDETFIFPEEFRRMKEPLRRYMDVLFKKNIFQESLLFRGIYFTSGIQDKKPLDGLLGQTAGLVQAAPAAASTSAAPPRAQLGEESIFPGRRIEEPLYESKPYFIRDFYSEKVFPEAALVRPTRARYQQAKKMTSILRAATLVIGIGGLAAFSIYAATILNGSRALTTAVTPLRDTLREVDADKEKWRGLDLTATHATAVSGAVDAARTFDHAVLRWLSIDLPTQRIRRDAFDALDSMLLHVLADRFVQQFPGKVRGTLLKGSAELSGQAPSPSQTDLVKTLLASWKASADDYQKVLQGNGATGRDRVQTLWLLATEDKPIAMPPALENFLARHLDAPEIDERLRALPPLEKSLPPIREQIVRKLGELDIAVKLPVEAVIDALRNMASQVRILTNEKAPFEDRRKALDSMVATHSRLPKDLLEPKTQPLPVEIRFAREFAERAKEMERILIDGTPLTKAPSVASGFVNQAVEGVASISGRIFKKDETALKASDDSWKVSDRWKRLQALLADEGLRAAGIGPEGGKKIAFLKEGEVPGPEGSPPERKVLYALAEEAQEFFREVEFVRERRGLLGASAADAALPADAMEKIGDAADRLLGETFIADDRHLALVQRVRAVLEGEKAQAAGAKPPAEGPKAPVTPGLVQVLKELVQREVRSALYQALVTSPAPAAETPRFPFGGDKEAEFLGRIESAVWLAAGRPERELVERIQIRHTQNRLRTVRRELANRPLFRIDPAQVTRWDFAPQSDEVNLTKLFGTPDAVFETYFNNQLRDLRIEYTSKMVKSRCLELLDARPQEVQGPDFGFWKETSSEAVVEGTAPEVFARRNQLKDLIKKVLGLRSNDRILFQSLTEFIDSEDAVKKQHDRNKSFLDSRHVEISDLVAARVRYFMAEKFKDEFERFAKPVYEALQGRFPVSFDPSAVEPYEPLREEMRRAEEFFLRWGLSEGPAAATEDTRKVRISNYIKGEFEKGADVDLAAAFRDLLKFVKGSFYQGSYGLSVRVLNRDDAFAISLQDEERRSLREANRLLREYWMKTGDTEMRLDQELFADVAWVNLQPVALRVRLTTEEDRYKIKGPRDQKPDREGRYEYAGGTKEHWALFRMFLDRKYRLEEGGNVLRFDFEVSPSIPLEGKELSSIPVYILVKARKPGAVGGVAGSAADYGRFDYDELKRLVGAIAEPTLRLVGPR